MDSAKDKIKVVIADDEPAARASMEILLRTEADIELVASSKNGQEALEAILNHQPDLVLLDIQMPELDGFEVLKGLDPARVPALIFVTAFDQYALRAFELCALDYLLKPYDDERFYQSLEKARDLLQKRQALEQWKKLEKLLGTLPATAETFQSRYPKRLSLKSQKRISFLEVEDIRYVESEGNFVKFHTHDGMKLGNFTFIELRNLLDPEQFVRIHKSYMVNVQSIHYLEPHFHGDYFVFLKGGDKLKLSRNYKDALAHLLG